MARARKLAVTSDPGAEDRSNASQARAALATTGNGKDKGQRLKVAEKMAKRIAGEKMPWANPFVSLILAGIAYRQGEKNTASALLSEAAAAFSSLDMHLYAAASKRRLGETLGGERGEQIGKEANLWMLSQKIKNPEAMTRMLAPGSTKSCGV